MLLPMGGNVSTKIINDSHCIILTYVVVTLTSMIVLPQNNKIEIQYDKYEADNIAIEVGLLGWGWCGVRSLMIQLCL